MIVDSVLKKLFSKRGMLFLMTRYGTSHTRQLALDGYYESGQWDYFETTHSDTVIEQVKGYLTGGRLLDLGCGPGTVAARLNKDAFSYYLGVDASSHAIKRARDRDIPNAHYQVSDFQHLDLADQVFDVILLEESIYYLPSNHLGFLDGLTSHLTDNGVFIVTIADPDRYHGIVVGIRERYGLLHDASMGNGRRLMMVFRQDSEHAFKEIRQ